MTLQEERVKMETQIQAMAKQVEELERERDKLVGHQNFNQKIQVGRGVI